MAMNKYTVIYSRYVNTNGGVGVGPQQSVGFDTLEEAVSWGNKEFAAEKNFAAWLRLPSGTTLIFTKMYGLV